MKFKVAFATNDGKNMVNKHYGDADFYVIYEISKGDVVFVEKRENSTTEADERFHGDPQKADKIGKIMQGVQVLCNKQFGKNIVNMTKKFVPILFDIDSIDDAIKVIQIRFDEVVEQLEAQENRKHLSFRNKN